MLSRSFSSEKSYSPSRLRCCQATAEPLFNVGTDSLRMILLKVMSAWTKMYDAAVPEPLREPFSECWRDQCAWISHEK